MAVSILDIALFYEAKENVDGSISMSEFDELGLPFFSGCQSCQASLGPSQAYPSKTGFIRCKECIGDLGFDTAVAFNKANPL